MKKMLFITVPLFLFSCTSPLSPPDIPSSTADKPSVTKNAFTEKRNILNALKQLAADGLNGIDVSLLLSDGETPGSEPYGTYQGNPVCIGTLQPKDVSDLLSSQENTLPTTLNDCYYSLQWTPKGGRTNLGVSISQEDEGVIMLNQNDGSSMEFHNKPLYDRLKKMLKQHGAWPETVLHSSSPPQTM